MSKNELDYLLNLNLGDKLPESILELDGYCTSMKNIKFIEDTVVEEVSKSSLSELSDRDLYKSIYSRESRKRINPFFKVVLDKMVKDGKIFKSSSGYSKEDTKSVATRPTLTDEESKVLEKFNAGTASTKISTIEGLPYSSQRIKELVFKLQKNKYIVRLTEGVYIKSTSIEDAESKIINFLKDKETIKVSEFRDLIGCGRKLAMEILDYFDREAVTLRSGDFRKLRK